MVDTSVPKIPFNHPHALGTEFEYIRSAMENGHLAGDGPFTDLCEDKIIEITGAKSAHLVHSGTAALELAALLCDLKPGDEVILPSYTFVSTANAVVLRGATPVFVDIDAETLNLNPELIKEAITDNTRLIMPIHYAGVVADMPAIMDIALQYDRMFVVEDAAQALGSKLDSIPAGNFGDLAAFSFHETKNIISGEGGALTVRNKEFSARAEIIREKGTNRKAFFRGDVDKYTWIDIGSSYLPSELIAAFLWAQLEQHSTINKSRIEAWCFYDDAFRSYEKYGVRCPVVPSNCDHNGHMYYLLMENTEMRTAFIKHMREHDITTPFHYVPLHSSTYGETISRVSGNMDVTNRVSSTLVRLPLYYGISEPILTRITDVACNFLDRYN